MSLAIEHYPSLDTLETAPQPNRRQLHFQPRTQATDRHVVIPDIHGEYRVLQKIIDRYETQPDIAFVFLGDLIDRKGAPNDPERGVYKTLDIVADLGKRAIITIGNHEWLFLGSSHARDSEQRRAITKEWLGDTPNTGIEHNVLLSYGLDPEHRDEYAAMRLRSQMARAGHLGLLTNAAPYYETAQFIATHAGIFPDIDWLTQRTYLHEVAREMDEGLFYDRPPQWFSMKLATSTLPIDATTKTVVSGHAHVLKNTAKPKPGQSMQRIINNGKRVRLASTLNAPTNAPAYVWQDWDERVIEIPRDA